MTMDMNNHMQIAEGVGAAVWMGKRGQMGQMY